MDESDLAEIYRSYGAMVYRRSLRLLRDEGEALDVTQEVFIRGMRHVARLRAGPELYGWLVRAATNLALNRLRDARTQRTYERTAVEMQAGAPVSLETLLCDRALISRVLEGLDEQTRLAAVYVLVEGMSHDEAAAALQISPRTVRNKLARFLDRARQRLGVGVQGAHGEDA